MNLTKRIFITIALMTAVSCVGTACVPEETSGRKEDSSGASTDKTTDKEKTKKSPTDEVAYFKDCASKSATSAMQDAVKHVTKITGVQDQNNIADRADVYTSLDNDLIKNAGTADLIAAAFTSCYDSKNGMVTIHAEDGAPLSSKNY